ncbi:MAG TPA: hypothetical protein VK062_00775, partial [Burkholderiaceae bacterium]|nr:hypothetical protein [Burkholderiaceae bacterium]
PARRHDARRGHAVITLRRRQDVPLQANAAAAAMASPGHRKRPAPQDATTMAGVPTDMFRLRAHSAAAPTPANHAPAC